MAKRVVEVFTAGGYLCDNTVQQVKEQACSNCEIKVYDLNKKCETKECETKAKDYGIEKVPAVAVNGELADCCSNRGIDFERLKNAGLGQ